LLFPSTTPGRYHSQEAAGEGNDVKKLYWILVMATLLAANMSQATDEQRKSGSSRDRWIEHQLRNGKYELSLSEQEGLYFCSVDSQRVVEVQFERHFVTIIFDPGAPLFFRQAELPSDLLHKLGSMRSIGFYGVLCVHSFFRDDWQKRYDEHGQVTHRLLDIFESVDGR
jgi:hypothetical protein